MLAYGEEARAEFRDKLITIAMFSVPRHEQLEVRALGRLDSRGLICRISSE
jgi:hypothetical protein